MSKKGKMLLMLAGFFAAVAMAVPAQAGGGGGYPDEEDEGPQGKCPKGQLVKWKLVRNDDAKCQIQSEYTDDEGNGDGYVCERWKNGHLDYRDNDK